MLPRNEIDVINRAEPTQLDLTMKMSQTNQLQQAPKKLSVQIEDDLKSLSIKEVLVDSSQDFSKCSQQLELPGKVVEQGPKENQQVEKKVQVENVKKSEQQNSEVSVTNAFEKALKDVQEKNSEISVKVAPNELKKKIPSVVDKSEFSEVSELNTLRQNHQEVFSPKPRLKVPASKPKKIFYKDLSVRELKAGKRKVQIMNADAENKIFYVLDLENFEKDEKHYEQIEKIIQDCVANDKTTSYEPEIEEMVLAKYDEVFYRGVCDAKKGDQYVIVFVDYGNISKVDSSDIRCLSPKLQMEIILQEIFIDNFQKTKKCIELIQDPSGFEIEVLNERTKEGSRIANLIGL